MAQSSSDDSPVCYILLVLWMTPCLPIMGHMVDGLIGCVLTRGQHGFKFATSRPTAYAESDQPGGSTGAKS